MSNYPLIPAICIALLGCSMSPSKVDKKVKECNASEYLKPLVVLGGNGRVKNVVCTVDESSGLDIITRELPPILKLPLGRALE